MLRCNSRFHPFRSPSLPASIFRERCAVARNGLLTQVCSEGLGSVVQEKDLNEPTASATDAAPALPLAGPVTGAASGLAVAERGDQDEEELVAESLKNAELLLDSVRAYALILEASVREGSGEPGLRAARERAEQELQLAEARFRRGQRELAREARRRQQRLQELLSPSREPTSSGGSLRVLIADDHRLVREALRIVLEQQGIAVVGEAEHGREAVKKARELHPDVVLMDVTMPELNGVDGTRRLTQEVPRCKVIGLSMHADRRYVLAMLEAGAAGYLLKTANCEELVHALHAVHAGNKYVTPSITGVVLEATAGPSSSRPSSSRPAPACSSDKPLSPREREVLQLLAEGCSSKEIANRLNVSLPTVETHRRQIAEKLNLRTIAALTKYAIREGLTSLDR